MDDDQKMKVLRFLEEVEEARGKFDGTTASEAIKNIQESFAKNVGFLTDGKPGDLPDIDWEKKYKEEIKESKKVKDNKRNDHAKNYLDNMKSFRVDFVAS